MSSRVDTFKNLTIYYRVQEYWFLLGCSGRCRGAVTVLSCDPLRPQPWTLRKMCLSMIDDDIPNPADMMTSTAIPRGVHIFV